MRIAAFIAAVALAGAILLGCGGSGGGQVSSSGTGATGGAASGAKGGSKRGAAAEAAKAARSAETGPYAGTRRLPFDAITPSASQRAHLARTGQVAIPVHVRGAGTVSAFGQAEFEGTIRKVAHAATVQASGPGTVQLKLRLTPAARRYLAKGSGHSILMYVGVFFSKSRSAERLVVPLQG